MNTGDDYYGYYAVVLSQETVIAGVLVLWLLSWDYYYYGRRMGRRATTGGPRTGARAKGLRKQAQAVTRERCAPKGATGAGVCKGDGRAVRERCASKDATTRATGVWCVSAARLRTQQRRVVRERCAPMGAATGCKSDGCCGAIVLQCCYYDGIYYL